MIDLNCPSCSTQAVALAHLYRGNAICRLCQNKLTETGAFWVDAKGGIRIGDRVVSLSDLEVAALGGGNGAGELIRAPL